jgi:alpha/beta superfamily hydrolase
MLLLLANRNPFDTAVMRTGTGAATAVSSARGIALAQHPHPVAVYTLTADERQAEYIFLNRRGT